MGVQGGGGGGIIVNNVSCPFRTFSLTPRRLAYYVHAKKAAIRDTHMPMAALRFLFTTVVGSLKIVSHDKT